MLGSALSFASFAIFALGGFFVNASVLNSHNYSVFASDDYSVVYWVDNQLIDTQVCDRDVSYNYLPKGGLGQDFDTLVGGWYSNVPQISGLSIGSDNLIGGSSFINLGEAGGVVNIFGFTQDYVGSWSAESDEETFGQIGSENNPYIISDSVGMYKLSFFSSPKAYANVLFNNNEFDGVYFKTPMVFRKSI